MHPQELEDIRSEAVRTTPTSVDPPAPQSIDVHNVEYIAQESWQVVLDLFTRDMDPWNIDIGKLADRFKNYVQKRKGYDMEVPGKIILLASILLKMKAELLFSTDVPNTAEEEEEFFEEDIYDAYEVEQTKLSTPPNIVFPVKRFTKRKVTLDELKFALGKAVNLRKKREVRQINRTEDYGLVIQEKDIKSRLEALFGTLKGLVDGGKDRIHFAEIIGSREKVEKIERFVELLHLESEDKVECIQEEFFGEIEIILKEMEQEMAYGG